MEMFLDKHQTFLNDLVNGGVRFIIIGGYAVIYHGYVRTTGDLDIWLEPDNRSKEKLLAVLLCHGISKKSVQKLAGLNFEEVVAFHFGDPPERVDFLTQLSGLSFDPSYAKSVILDLPSCKLHILHLSDLIINKMMTTRLRDKADVEELLKIQSVKRKMGF